MHLQFEVKEQAEYKGQLALPNGLICRCVGIMLICMIFVLGLSPFLPAFSQSETQIQVLAPEVIDFPVVSIQFKLDHTALPIESDLQVEQLIVLESEKPVQILSLTKVYAGMYFTLAINGARDLDLRNTFGISVYENLSDALIDWASSRQYHLGDTWSLVNNEGTGVRNMDSQDVWIDALRDYQPNFRKLEPNLSSLEAGIQLASERVVPFSVDKTLLYVTPPPGAEELLRVNALAEEARLAGVQVNVWMVGDALFLDNDQGKALMNLANKTGGQFYHFTGVQSLPDPETYLANLGYTHILTYESSIRETGSYPVTLEVSLPEAIIRAESIPFYIEVSPPNPMLVSPPAVITRKAVIDEAGQNNWNSETYEINIMVDFPDDHPREIAVSRLYVDGDLTAQQTEPPFETLSWNLAELIESGEHTLQVEVEDVWGLTDRSIITPIQIEVILPEPSPPFPLQQFFMAIVIGILAIAVVILLIWLARRGWKFPHLMRYNAQSSNASGGSTEKMPFRPKLGGKIFATLVPLSSNTEDMLQSSLPITQPRVTFGSDPSQADIELLQPGIAGSHADLYFSEGAFWLRDLKSQTGTWVNDRKICTEPVQLYPGDLIYFGETGFRFTMIGTDVQAEVSVSRYESIL